MQYTTYAPPLQLKDLVECFWCLESKKEEAAPQEYFLMADSCAEIIFQYNEGFKNYTSQSARMRFQHSVHDKFEVAARLGFFGVRLFPHAVNKLLGVAATEVANQVADFCILFKQEGTDLADQVYNAETALERVQLVSNFLMKRSARYQVDPINYFVGQVIRSAGGADIMKMQRESGLSIRQFERRFKATAGFPPKYFARIARFQSIKNSFASRQVTSMTSLAYGGNYYDQSHFNREFKEFAGVQPLKYFKSVNQNAVSTGRMERPLTGAESFNFDGYLPCGLFV